MEFDKIRFDGANVELLYQEALESEGKRDCADHGKNPTPAFKSALQAFSGYVAWIHNWPEDTASRIDVRQVTIKRPDDAPRGITVTALLKCPRARNSTSTLNTPYLSEPPANYSGDRSGFLPESTVTLIDELEAQAQEYHNGERGEQTSLPLGDSQNTKNADQKMAEAEVTSTRKPKGRNGKMRGKQSSEPTPISDLTDVGVRQLLASVDRDVPIEAITAASVKDRSEAIRWAECRQKEITGQLEDVFMPTEPEWLIRAATPPLKADEWTGDPPPPVSDEGAREIAVAAGRAD